MSRTISLLAASAVLLFSLPPASAVTINWVPVGNPGNLPDTVVMSDGTTGYGSVPYAYNIDKYDVTVSQYVELLNAKDPTGANNLGLYNSVMSNTRDGGIDYDAGQANGSKYGVIAGRGVHPASYVTWYDTIRFANWLNNGQGSGDTESGAYTVLGGTPTPSNGLSITRNAGATVFLPSDNEWYKAAYYNPVNNSYYQYPTSSNLVPTVSGPTATPNSANYTPGGPGTMTDVGAYSGTTSPYGLYDMGGNVWQWNEALIFDIFRGLRGGSYGNSSPNLMSSIRGFYFPSGESGIVKQVVGFRVASVVPEPNSAVLAAVGFAGLIAWAWRRRKRLGPS